MRCTNAQLAKNPIEPEYELVGGDGTNMEDSPELTS